MNITGIKQAKKDTNRVHLYENEKYIGTVYIDMLLKYHITERENVDDDDINKALTESNNLKLFNLSVSYIARRARSEREIKNYISQKIFKYKWNPENINTNVIIDKLYNYKYLDDKSFAEMWVKERIKKGKGPVRLRQELIMKGVDKEIINEALHNIDIEDENISKEKLTEKYLKNKIFKSEIEKKWKLSQYLRSRGF
ncbi:MAG: regulatory protein RecX [bacterium]